MAKQTIDGRIIALDETEHWRLAAEQMALIERIETVYWFDALQATYAAEMTTSYTLHPLYTRAIFKADVAEDAQHAIDEIIEREADNDITYMHCAQIHRLITQYRKEKRAFAYTRQRDRINLNKIDGGYDGAVDAILEHDRCNWPL